MVGRPKTDQYFVIFGLVLKSGSVYKKWLFSSSPLLQGRLVINGLDNGGWRKRRSDGKSNRMREVEMTHEGRAASTGWSMHPSDGQVLFFTWIKAPRWLEFRSDCA